VVVVVKKALYIILGILISIFSIVFFTYDYLKYYEKILKEVENIEVNINSYSVFGTSFNITGCINVNLQNPSLILKNKNEEIILDSIFYKQNNNTCFYISKNNNQGINLDNLKIGDYLLLVKDTEKYYTLKNNTNYENIEYYTITKNKSNNKINIDFNEYENKNYLNIKIEKTKLPKDVYDITIDPGHGGKDPGAIGKLNGKDYYESNLTLKISLLLKKELEKLGLKVKLTREKDIYLDPYGEGGRAIIPNDYNTKYSFSIHLNSSNGSMNYGGVEIYTPNNVDLTLASMLADNLSDVVGYSKKNSFKLKDGVYYQYFKQSDIETAKEDMLKENNKPYNIVLNSPYMYMIREIGGIHTSAYIDGRNEDYGLNKYYNSNKTPEPYLFELAYINYPNDLNKVVDKPELFSKNISKAIKDYLELS